MRVNGCHLAWLIALLGSAAGCAEKPADRAPGAGETAEEAEKAVRKKFAEVQAALKPPDADRLWALLSVKSRAAAETEAKVIRTSCEQASASEKLVQEKDLGLSGQELAGLTGKGFLKTRRFQRKYHEVPDSTIERVTASGDTATVYFDEPDGDKEKLIFVREEGQWKAWMAMPKKKP